MPTEHEYKFVMRKEIFSDPRLQPQKTIHIRQGYIHPDVNLRIRCEDGRDWLFVYKTRALDLNAFQGRQIEIQTKIDQRDGEDLWKLCDRKLEKYRHVCVMGGYKWELDKFVYCGETYFSMMEVELDEGLPSPPLPPLFEQYLLWEVPLTESCCSNTKLTDVHYAANLYLELLTKRGGKK